MGQHANRSQTLPGYSHPLRIRVWPVTNDPTPLKPVIAVLWANGNVAARLPRRGHMPGSNGAVCSEIASSMARRQHAAARAEQRDVALESGFRQQHILAR